MKNPNPTSGLFCEHLHELYLRYHGFVRHVCIRYVQNPEEADDLAQEALIKAARGWERFSGDCRAGTWMYRVAANHCVDYLRRRRRQVESARAYAEERRHDATGGGAEDFLIPARRVRATLEGQLNEIDRHVLYLRFELGLTQAGIAEILGVSRTAAANRLGRIQRQAADLWRAHHRTEQGRGASG